MSARVRLPRADEPARPGGDDAAPHVSTRTSHRFAWFGVGLYCVLAIVIYLPVLPFDGRHLPGGGTGDPALEAWFLAWTPHALLAHLNPLFTNFIDYPSGVNLMTNTSAPALGLLAAPVTLLLGPVAALNLMLRLAFAASASSMFLVLRRWTTWWPAAFIGGLFYGFSPYMVSQGQEQAHLNLLVVALFPLMLACLDELFIGQRRDPRRLGVALGLLAAVQLLISAELLADSALLGAIGLLALAVTHRSEVGARVRWAMPGIGVAAAVFVVLAAYPTWFFVSGPQHISGPHQPLSVLQLFRTDLLSPILPTIHQQIAPARLTRLADQFFAGNPAENGAYLGLPLILLVVIFTIVWRRDGVVRFASFMAIVALVAVVRAAASGEQPPPSRPAPVRRRREPALPGEHGSGEVRTLRDALPRADARGRS